MKFENSGGLEECDTITAISVLNGRGHSLDIIKSKSGRRITSLLRKRFGRLVVVSYAGVRSKQCPVSLWTCKCDCGTEKVVRSDLLKRGLTKSCGCLYARKGLESPLWNGIGDISKTVLTRIKQDAKTRKIPFDLTLEYLWELYLKQNKKCALTGDDICFGAFAKDNSRTASLDRIDSSFGYVTGNVQWVHKTVNFAKQSLSQKEFIALCHRVATYSV